MTLAIEDGAVMAVGVEPTATGDTESMPAGRRWR